MEQSSGSSSTETPASIFWDNLWTFRRSESTAELPAQRTPVITRASACPTSENPSAPAPGGIGGSTASSVITDNQETQDVRERLLSILSTQHIALVNNSPLSPSPAPPSQGTARFLYFSRESRKLKTSGSLKDHTSEAWSLSLIETVNQVLASTHFSHSYQLSSIV